jgi:hypothetical protein
LEHIKALCKKFQVQNWENYCLQDTSTRHYISPEEFDYPADYKLQEESMLSLKLHPTYATTTMLRELRSSTELATKKKILFQLRIKLVVRFFIYIFFQSFINDHTHDHELPIHSNFIFNFEMSF